MVPMSSSAAPTMLLSVVVTFFNQREFVRPALDSVLVQQREGLEIIAVDDGSTDGTGEVLQHYAEQVRIVTLVPNQGVSAARNRGVAEASGAYVAFLDGDDALAPWAVDTFDAVVRSRTPMLVLGTLFWFTGEVPCLTDSPREARFVEYRDYFEKDRSVGARAGALVVNRRAFLGAGGWDPAVSIGEDYDLVWRLGTAGRLIYLMDPPTTLHRAHDGQTTRQPTRMLGGMAKLAQREKAGMYPGGRGRRLERRACVGGCLVSWALALRQRAYGQALMLVARHWTFVLAAVVVRVRARLGTLSPVQVLPLAERVLSEAGAASRAQLREASRAS
jgi:hypothetical protein